MPASVRSCGFVLILVLVVIAMMAMIAAGVLYQARAEISASAASTNRQQAKASAMSGIIYTAAILKKSSGDPSVWTDNPELFRNKLVCEDGADKWYFSVYASKGSDFDEPRFGVIDEGGKLSVNVADEKAIKKLLAREKNGDLLADALLDYRDSDSNPREHGAEQDYYDQLSTPYTIKNGPITTIEELLCVKDFNAQVVFGEDANLNGILDPNEKDGDESFPPDDGDGQLNLGLRSLMTPMTWATRAGLGDKVDLNRARNNQLNDLGLPQQTVDFIQAYRGDGGAFTHPSQLLEMKYTLKNDSRAVPRLKKGMEITSGVGKDELPTVMEKCVASQGGRGGGMMMMGLVNVNSAPAEVLSALLDDETLGAKVADARDSLSPEQRTSTAWLYTEGIVDADKYKQVAPRLGGQSYQFRVYCVGFAHPSGRYCVLEAVIDLSRVNPRITYVRDITRLGMPFATEIEKQRN